MELMDASNYYLYPFLGEAAREDIRRAAERRSTVPGAHTATLRTRAGLRREARRNPFKRSKA